MGRRRRSPRSPGRAVEGPPTLAGHRVVGPVGFGSDGAVWAAQDAAGRDVVVSVLALSAGSSTVRRLAAMRQGTHPHLARIRQVLPLDDARCAVVSDRVDGPTLATVVAARGTLDAGELAGVLAGLGSALGHLHERGIVHGDVSPANIIVTPEGQVVLGDLAGQASRELGTPGFVAPERTRGAAAGAAGDVWALARVLEWAGGSDRDADGAGGGAGAKDQAGHAGPSERVRGLATVLAPALDPQPGRRPSARDLASGAPVLAAATHVRVPPPHALAQARMRDASAPTQKRASRRATAAAGTPGQRAPDEAASRSRVRGKPLPSGAPARPTSRGTSVRSPALPTRHRRGNRSARVTRWAPAWSVTTGALLVAAVLLVVVPRVGEEPAASPTVTDSPATRAAEIPPPPDLAVVADLFARRDAALAAQDSAALAATSVPGSAAAVTDAELLTGMRAAGTVVEGLRIEASDLRTVATSGGTAVVEVLLGQSAHERLRDEERVSVAALPPGCARLTFARATAGDWLLSGSAPCP